MYVTWEREFAHQREFMKWCLSQTKQGYTELRKSTTTRRMRHICTQQCIGATFFCRAQPATYVDRTLYAALGGKNYSGQVIELPGKDGEFCSRPHTSIQMHRNGPKKHSSSPNLHFVPWTFGLLSNFVNFFFNSSSFCVKIALVFLAQIDRHQGLKVSL